MDQSDYVIRYHALLEESKRNYLYSLFICLYSKLTIGLTNERVQFLMALKYMIVGEKFLICWKIAEENLNKKPVRNKLIGKEVKVKGADNNVDAKRAVLKIIKQVKISIE